MMHVGASRTGWVRSVASASEDLIALNAADSLLSPCYETGFVLRMSQE